MSQGPKSLLNLIVVILLVSPWYMYQGSCFREVCVGTVAVGGHFRDSTGVCIYLYIIICQFMSILYHFQGPSEKGTFSESCTF